MPTGAELLYFLSLDSDIVQENLANGLTIKRMTPDDWRAWFGVEIQYYEPGHTVRGIQSVSVGPYSRAPRISEQNDIVGLKLYEKNYVIFSDQADVRAHVEKFDQGLRLFATGRSGISSGFSNSKFEYFHPQAGWSEIPSSVVKISDLEALAELCVLVGNVVDEKALLLIDRYRNATQGTNDIKPHNRFIDLVTILEMLFVPDGKSGEISYKLRMRGSCILSEEMGTARAAVADRLKNIYNLRSRIVHDGDHQAVPSATWVELTTYCRKSIVRYLRAATDFTATALDSKILVT
ncbi:MAG: hypothetical protein IPM97_00250 [Bdellovibrionaceae bacterium]|nr:hypothetical protein [Pseudobdellovibrionaceae bacterium]